MMGKEEVIKTWIAWDEYPGGEKTSKDRLKAINEYAESMNIDPLAFRRKLAQARRDGMTYERAVDEASNNVD